MPPHATKNELAAPYGLATSATVPSNSILAQMRAYASIARPDHWIKNVFMLLGSAIAMVLHRDALTSSMIGSVLLGLLATSLIASSNYVLNEILDAKTDAVHPDKRYRPIPRGLVSVRGAYAEWLALGIIGLGMSALINLPFALSALALWIMGIIYNVPPVRSKEIPIVDVLSESVNNPIRLLLGWYAVGEATIPPSSILLAYWMLGAFLMAAKRLGEWREIRDGAILAAYRHSFRWYTEDRLMVSMVMYVAGFMFFFAVVMTKYHPELILSAPVLMVLVGYIVRLSFQPRSPVQHPERLLTEPYFVAFAILSLVVIFALSMVSIPPLKHVLGLDGREW